MAVTPLKPGLFVCICGLRRWISSPAEKICPLWTAGDREDPYGGGGRGKGRHAWLQGEVLHYDRACPETVRSPQKRHIGEAAERSAHARPLILDECR